MTSPRPEKRLRVETVDTETGQVVDRNSIKPGDWGHYIDRVVDYDGVQSGLAPQRRQWDHFAETVLERAIRHQDDARKWHGDQIAYHQGCLDSMDEQKQSIESALTRIRAGNHV